MLTQVISLKNTSRDNRGSQIDEDWNIRKFMNYLSTWVSVKVCRKLKFKVSRFLGWLLFILSEVPRFTRLNFLKVVKCIAHPSNFYLIVWSDAKGSCWSANSDLTLKTSCLGSAWNITYIHVTVWSTVQRQTFFILLKKENQSMSNYAIILSYFFKGRNADDLINKV